LSDALLAEREIREVAIENATWISNVTVADQLDAGRRRVRHATMLRDRR
jgi:hypothetical protein